MGCGISTLGAEDASKGGRHPSRVHHHANIAPPVAKNKKYCDNDDPGVVVVNEAKTKEGGFNGEKFKKKSVVVDRKEEERLVLIKDRQGEKDEHAIGDEKHVKNEEEENNTNNNHDDDDEEERDDRFIGPKSPSFREYCNDYDYGDRSSVGDSNDCESGESTKNGSDDDSTNRLINEKSVDIKKEPEKKERRGRGFRNVMNKGKPRGKRNLLSFGCYNSSTQSYAEGSFSKIVEKNA